MATHQAKQWHELLTEREWREVRISRTYTIEDYDPARHELRLLCLKLTDLLDRIEAAGVDVAALCPPTEGK